MNPNNDVLVSNSPNDSLSSLKWSPTDQMFAVTAWDGTVSLYNNQPQAQKKFETPLLCCDWKPDGSAVLVGGCDNKGYLWDPKGNQHQQVAQHEYSISCCKFVSPTIFVTAGWDSKLRYWDITKAGQEMFCITLPERPYCMDFRDNMLAVGCADRKVRIFEANNPNRGCVQEVNTTLKHQFRSISLFPDLGGFGVSSIEGRVQIHTFGDKDKKTFAYKCHRNDQYIFPVHCIKFHKLGTFLTAGGDGTVLFWDKDQRQKLKALEAVPRPVTAADFDNTYQFLAYGCSYDWSQGQSGYNSSEGSQIYIRQLQPEDVTRKKKF